MFTFFLHFDNKSVLYQTPLSASLYVGTKVLLTVLKSSDYTVNVFSERFLDISFIGFSEEIRVKNPTLIFSSTDNKVKEIIFSL